MSTGFIFVCGEVLELVVVAQLCEYAKTIELFALKGKFYMGCELYLNKEKTG